MSDIWKPFPKQERALTIWADMANEILFGGARGPGKTDAGQVWMLGEEIDDQGHLYIDHPRYRALILRRNYDDLTDWIDRAERMYKRYGARVVGKPAEIRWPSGAKFRLGHLRDKKSYEKYLGHEYQRILIEELTQIVKEDHYIKIIGSLRSTVDKLKPQIFCTTNPPGAGHIWVKKRFVTPAMPNTIFEGEDGRKRIYIPATLDDNPILMKKDPSYVAFLDGLKLTDPDLYESWRHGSWDVMAGQYFKTWRARTHTTNPFKPKDGLVKMAGVDWGRTNPFAFIAGALQNCEYLDNELNKFNFNRVWIFGEVYGTEKTPKEWASIIKKRFNIEDFSWIRGDPAMFHKLDDGSTSISKQFSEEGVNMLPANNDRIGGWEAVKNWFSIAPDGLPYCIISKSCVNLIEEIPTQVHDENKVEDLDTSGVDHAVDGLRYLLIHTKWIDAYAGVIQRKSHTPKIPGFTHVDPDSFK